MMKSIKTWILVGFASLLLVACGQGGGGSGVGGGGERLQSVGRQGRTSEMVADQSHRRTAQQAPGSFGGHGQLPARLAVER